MKKILTNILKKYNYKIVKIQEIDTYIISFPKCGRTWLNLMLGKLFEQHIGCSHIQPDKLFDLQLFNSFFSEQIPLINFTHDDNKNFFRPPEKLKKNKEKYKNSKVIFLLRDPRDVLISSFFEKTKRNNIGRRKDSFWKPFSGTISSYIYEKNGGFDTIIEFYNIWHKNKDVPKNFMLLKYEDLQTDVLNQLTRIINFIGIKNIKPESFEKAIEYSNFNNMQKIEKNSNIKTDKLKPADKEDVDTYKTRKGKIGGYKDYLTDGEIEYLDNKIRIKLNNYFGYNG